eukprot:GHVN01059512.1.p1 GENE.GHVN01059512.1~~GHVN01059512.1.p1  ORF type:complete len:326 (-),score=31.14 GHVN01059512.1:144-1121(-)
MTGPQDGFSAAQKNGIASREAQDNLFSFKFVHPDFAECTPFEGGDIDTLAQKLQFQDIEPDVSIQASFQSNAEGPHGPAYSLASRSCATSGLSHLLIRNDFRCDQFNFEGRMLVAQSSGPSKAKAGFVFGFKDPANYLLLEFDGAEFFLKDFTAAAKTDILSGKFELKPDTWYKVKITVNEGAVRAVISDEGSNTETKLWDEKKLNKSDFRSRRCCLFPCQFQGQRRSIFNRILCCDKLTTQIETSRSNQAIRSPIQGNHTKSLKTQNSKLFGTAHSCLLNGRNNKEHRETHRSLLRHNLKMKPTPNDNLQNSTTCKHTLYSHKP